MMITFKNNQRTIQGQKKKMSTLFEKIYDIVRNIPPGKVSTYGRIAAFLGTSPKVVGLALNKSKNIFPPVPAHRVVNKKGILTGKIHFNPPDLMEELLKKEGIPVKNNKVINFKKFIWEPSD